MQKKKHILQRILKIFLFHIHKKQKISLLFPLYGFFIKESHESNKIKFKL